MKKQLAILLAGILLLGALCGCKHTAAPQTAIPDVTAIPAPTAEPTAAPVDPLAEVDKAEITESKHAREEAYTAVFRTKMLETPLAAVHLEDNDAYSDEALRALAKTVVTDLLTLKEQLSETPRRVTVYITQRMLICQPLPIDERVFCTVSDVENGAYREALAGACYGFTIPWKQVGLTEIVFGTPDASGLKAYYADEAHALTASCAAVYLIPEVADEETVAAARQTAASITAYLLANGGFDALKAVQSTAGALPAWSDTVGLDAAPVLPEGHEQAGVMTGFRDRTPSRICILKCGNLTVNVKKDSFAQTPDELYAFLCKFFRGAEVVLAQIAEEAPFLSETAEAHYAAPFIINLEPDPTDSGISTTWGETIDLRHESSAWHELVHWLLWKGELWQEDASGNRWLSEAIAEHFSYRAQSIALDLPYDEEEDRAALADGELSDAERSFFMQCIDLYAAERSKDEDVPLPLVSYGILRRTEAVCSLLTEYDVFDGEGTLAAVRGIKADAKATDPNALLYIEAPVFMEYLFGLCGEEAVLTGYWNNVPLKDVCGKDYPELFQDFLADLRDAYGALLNME